MRHHPGGVRIELPQLSDIDADGFAGAATLHALDWRHRRGEVGFWLVPHARGRGLARRAVGC